MVKIALYFFAVLAIIFGYAKYIELHGLYYPSRNFEATPAFLKLAYEDIFALTEDGLRIHGWFIPAPEARFTLLFCHGNGGNISHRLEKIKLFHDLGLDVCIIDYRGYGKNRGRPSEKGLYRDASAAYKYLVKERAIAPEQIVLYGESLGTAVVVHLASREKTRGVILEGAFSRGRDMARVAYPFLPSVLVTSYDSLAKIKDIRVPKLFFHSREDEVVPFRLAEKLFSESGEAKTFVELQGGHNDCVFESEEVFVSSLKTFIQTL